MPWEIGAGVHERTHPLSLADTTAADLTDAIGARLPYELGPHRLLSLVGEGGAGRVYLAQSLRGGSLYALKLCRGEGAPAIARLKAEFRMLDAVRSPGIVRGYRLGCWDGYWGFTMQLCEGSRLLDYTRTSIPRGRPGHPDRIRTVLWSAAESLARVHRAGLVHRDVKPSNFVVDRQGRALLLDFSLAATLKGRLGLPVPGPELAGTFQYLAPEVVEHRLHSPAADVFSLGRVLFQMLSGRLPSVDATCRTDCDWFASQLAPQLPEGVPAELAELAVRMQLPDPAQRPTSEEIVRRFQPQRVGRLLRYAPSGDSWPLMKLHRHLRSVVEGRSQLVVLPEREGETDATFDTFVEHARSEDPLLVLRGGNCAREELPLAAWDSVLTGLADWVRRLPPALQADFPLEGNAALASLDRPEGFAAQSAAVLSDAEGLVRKIARSRVLVVFIRRIDCAGEASIALLRRLLAEHFELRVLVVATRPASRSTINRCHELASRREAVAP